MLYMLIAYLRGYAEQLRLFRSLIRLNQVEFNMQSSFEYFNNEIKLIDLYKPKQTHFSTEYFFSY